MDERVAVRSRRSASFAMILCLLSSVVFFALAIDFADGRRKSRDRKADQLDLQAREILQDLELSEKVDRVEEWRRQLDASRSALALIEEARELRAIPGYYDTVYKEARRLRDEAVAHLDFFED